MRHLAAIHTSCGVACTWTATASWIRLAPDLISQAPLSQANLRLATIAICSTLAAATCTWLAISYVGLAHITRGDKTLCAAFARKFGSPKVRRAISLFTVSTSLFPLTAQAVPAQATSTQTAPTQITETSAPVQTAPASAQASSKRSDTEVLPVSKYVWRAEGKSDDLGDIGWGASTSPPAPQPSSPDVLPSDRASSGTASSPAMSPSAASSPAASPRTASSDTSLLSRSPQRPSPRTRNPQEQKITVLPGDCLWTIAARDLPEGASSAEIASHTLRWFEANRAVLSDPNIVHPGQILTAPKEEQ